MLETRTNKRLSGGTVGNQPIPGTFCSWQFASAYIALRVGPRGEQVLHMFGDSLDSYYRCKFCRNDFDEIPLSQLSCVDLLLVVFCLRRYQCPHCFSQWTRLWNPLRFLLPFRKKTVPAVVESATDHGPARDCSEPQDRSSSESLQASGFPPPVKSLFREEVSIGDISAH